MEAQQSIALSEVALKKLTVSQLKSMCKERRVVGYSKLTKDGIIQKLLDNSSISKAKAQSCLVPIGINKNPALTNSNNKRPGPTMEEDLREIRTELSIGQGSLNQSAEVEMLFSHSPPAFPDGVPPANSRTIIEHKCIAGPSKTSVAGTRILPVPKKARLYTPNTGHAHTCTPQDFGLERQGFGHAGASQTLDSPNGARGLAETINAGTKPFSNRKFKLLEPFRPQAPVDYAKASAILPSERAPGNSEPTKNVGGEKDLQGENPTSHLEHLNFPPEEKLSLTGIQFPPSVAQRKHIPNLSLILSRISFKDLGSCALVSRAFRYAAYLSAFHRLSKKFPGKRLDDVLRHHPSNMANLWPYLRLREREVDTRKSIYKRSFLSKALLGIAQVDQKLWHSPNHERQIIVALRSEFYRFLTTKLFFLISMGLGIDHYNPSMTVGRVVDAEEVIENEVWKITYWSSSSIQTFYVLESTCEVIGESSSSSDKPVPSTVLREDWLTYISTGSIAPDGVRRQGLLEHLRWSNHEEYEKGISKVWLKRIRKEGKLGLAKWKIAIRYVFASVVANSISGPWRSANEMEQDFERRVSVNTARNEKAKCLSLFLPMHHHVESVHFTSTNRLALHEALAVVQTSGREYFILRDNGMQVGCEEEGVGLVWMKILGCSENGCVKSSPKA